MELSDFPYPFIIGLHPWTFRCGLRNPHCEGKYGISRFPREVFPYVLEVSDRAGSVRISR
jgi:hypothetical protein